MRSTGPATAAEAPPIIQYWHDEDVPDYIRELFDAFRTHNPKLQHRVFSEATADTFIAENLGKRELEAFRACAVPALQADYFRLCGVYVLGGVWCDADILCVSSLSPLLNGHEGGELFWYPTGQAVCNGFFIFSQRRHPLLKLAIDIATAQIENRISERVDVVAGSWVFTVLVEAQRSGSFDAWLDSASGQMLQPFRRKPHHKENLRRLIEDSQLGEAFQSVSVQPRSKLDGLLLHPVPNLPYKNSESHFLNFKGSIYRAT